MFYKIEAYFDRQRGTVDVCCIFWYVWFALNRNLLKPVKDNQLCWVEMNLEGWIGVEQ